MDVRTFATDMPIGKKVELLRILKAYTQEGVASKLGISKQAFSRIERSSAIPDERLQQIADIFKVSLKGLKSLCEADLFLMSTRYIPNRENCTPAMPHEKADGNSREQIDLLYSQIIQCQNEILQVRHEIIELYKKRLRPKAN